MKVSKIKSNFIFEDVRFNASYFLNEDALNSMKLETNKEKCVALDKVANAWNPPIFKRQFCERTNKSIPYCQSSDVANQLEGSDVYIYKEQALKVNSVVKENQILVTGFGTIGNTRLVNELSAGISYANNVCRIETNGKLPFGYVYAFLTSKYGRSQLNKNASGSVVRYIEAPGIKKTLIPVLSEEKQQQIHQLIVEASELRVEANRLLDQADKLFHLHNGISYEKYHLSASENEKHIAFKTKVKEIAPVSFKAKNHSKRILEIKEIWDKKSGVKLKNYLSKEFRIGARGAFKRYDGDNIGTEMISQSDLHRLNPKNYKRVIVSRHSIEDYANNNQVLFPAVGNGSSEGEILFRPTLAFKAFEGSLLSGDIGRFDCPSLEYAAYLLIALKSKGGFRMMRAMYYGSQLRRPLWELIREINIPISNDQSFGEIANTAIDAYKNICLADSKENQAIALIEKEIDLWQVS